MGADSWGSNGKVDGVLDGPWVLKDEDVLLGMLAKGVVVDLRWGEDHRIVFVVQPPVTN